MPWTRLYKRVGSLDVTWLSDPTFFIFHHDISFTFLSAISITAISILSAIFVHKFVLPQLSKLCSSRGFSVAYLNHHGELHVWVRACRRFLHSHPILGTCCSISSSRFMSKVSLRRWSATLSAWAAIKGEEQRVHWLHSHPKNSTLCSSAQRSPCSLLAEGL